MTKIIVFILILTTLSCVTKDYDNFTSSDFYVNTIGDTLFFPIADSINNNSKFYFYNNKSKVQEIRHLSNDTFLTSFISGNTLHEYYYKMRKAKENESHNYNPLVVFKYGTIISGRSEENLLCVKIIKYCENGNLIEEKVINSNIYKMYSCNGNLYSKADSCNSLFIPIGNYIQYDTLNNKPKIVGAFINCSDNPYVACENGWWYFYENGKIISKKLYDKGILIEEKDFK